MENYEFDFDKVYLWQIPYGSKILISKENLKEFGDMESFEMKKDFYSLIKIGKFHLDDTIELYCKEIEKFVYLPTKIEKDKHFEIIFTSNKEKLENLIDIYTIRTVGNIIDEEGSFDKIWIELVEEIIKQIELLNKLKKEIE